MMLVAAPTLGWTFAVGLLNLPVGRSAMMLDAALLVAVESKDRFLESRTNGRRVSERSISGLLCAVLMLEVSRKEYEFLCGLGG